LAVAAALGLIRVYRALVSPFLVSVAGTSCRFVPSCSEYARQAILQRGVLRGSWLAVKRLSRCHPLGAFGHDPLPESTEAPLGQ
jgi:putative membrane protein insertion efficiency factor